MEDKTKIGQLVIDLQMRTKALEQGLETAKKKIQEFEQNNKNLQNTNKSLEGTFIALSVTAIATLTKMVGAIKDCTDAYNEYNNANVGLKSILDGQGKSFTKAQEFIEEYISDGLVPLNNAVTAYKNLALRGYNDEQIKQTMINLKNAAAFGRQSTLEYGYAIQSATEGLKNFNPVLVDNAGVTKNMSVMYDEYAKKIGKTAATLTEEEKILAEVNGITEETKYQTGDAAKYADTYSGQQARLNAELLSTKQAVGESLIPILTQLTGVVNSVVSGIRNMTEENKAGTVGVMTFSATLLTTAVAIGGVIKLIGIYKASTLAATIQTQGFTAAILGNPLFMGTIAFAMIIAGISQITTEQKQQEETQRKLNEATERYKRLKEGSYGYASEEIQQIESDKSAIEEQIILLEKKMELEGKLNQIKERVKQNAINPDLTGLNELKKELKEVEKQYNKNIEANGKLGNSLEELNNRLNQSNEYLKKTETQKDIVNLLDTESIKNKKKEASTAVETAKSYQQLFQTYQEGKKGTKEYENAVTALEEKFPEAVNANGIIAKDMKILIDDMARNAQTSWDNTQSVIQDRIAKITEAIANCNPEIDVNGTYAKSLSDKIGIPTNEVIGSLQTALSLFDMLLNKDSTEVGGGKSKYTPPKTNKSSKTYQNKALDNYKKQIEYKKSLDQISLQEEISMYETALRKYAKTQDEKMELTTKVYELKKELQQAELDNDSALIDYLVSMDKISKQEQIGKYEWELKYLAKTTDQKRDLEVKIYELRKELNEEIAQQIKDEADKEREILNRKTEDYKRYIQDQKNLRGAEYDVKEQEADLNKIIEMHQNYLNQIMKDERYSLDERESIYREELEIIRDYEQQKRDARVSSVNNTVSQLKSAITKQIEEMQEADEKAIKKNIELVEEWKNARIDAINAEYNARIEAIQKELDALDKAEQQKSRDEEDAEYEKKKKRLEELAEYEHDATTKANYLKELAKLEEEYQKTVDKRLLEDKKEALKEQQDLLKEEQTSKTDAIKEEAEKQKEQYETQLDDLKEYYDKQKEMAQETAEKMLLNVEQNQNQILSLLNKYGDKYEITGQSLGEKLAQGINNGLANKIQGIIQTIQDRIDGAIENQISKWTSTAYQYEQATSKAQTKTVQTNVTQNNYIQQNPEMPSETYRKLNNVSRNLAAELAGV